MTGVALIERMALQVLDLPGRHRVSIAQVRSSMALSLPAALGLLRYLEKEGLSEAAGDGYVRLSDQGAEVLADLREVGP